MPARSKAQRRLMGMCEHHPEHAQGQCPDMSKEQMSDFASTKEGGLPEHVPEDDKKKALDPSLHHVKLSGGPKHRTQWSYFVQNPQGGGFGTNIGAGRPKRAAHSTAVYQHTGIPLGTKYHLSVNDEYQGVQTRGEEPWAETKPLSNIRGVKKASPLFDTLVEKADLWAGPQTAAPAPKKPRTPKAPKSTPASTAPEAPAAPHAPYDPDAFRALAQAWVDSKNRALDYKYEKAPWNPKNVKKSAISWLVDRYHVSAPHEEIERDIRKRATRGLRDGSIQPHHVDKWVNEAKARHAQNQALYGFVMGGRMGRQARSARPFGSTEARPVGGPRPPPGPKRSIMARIAGAEKSLVARLIQKAARSPYPEDMAARLKAEEARAFTQARTQATGVSPEDHAEMARLQAEFEPVKHQLYHPQRTELATKIQALARKMGMARGAKKSEDPGPGIAPKKKKRKKHEEGDARERPNAVVRKLIAKAQNVVECPHCKAHIRYTMAPTAERRNATIPAVNSQSVLREHIEREHQRRTIAGPVQKGNSMNMFTRLVQKANVGLTPPKPRIGRKQSGADYWRNAFKGVIPDAQEIAKSLTRKHFQAIADAFVDAHDSGGAEHEPGIAHAMNHVMRALRAQNPRFDEGRFRTWVTKRRAAQARTTIQGNVMRSLAPGTEPAYRPPSPSPAKPSTVHSTFTAKSGTAMRRDPDANYDETRKARTCPCGGEKVMLGKAGGAIHYQCRACKSMSMHAPPPRPARGTAHRNPIPGKSSPLYDTLRRRDAERLATSRPSRA